MASLLDDTIITVQKFPGPENDTGPPELRRPSSCSRILLEVTLLLDFRHFLIESPIVFPGSYL